MRPRPTRLQLESMERRITPTVVAQFLSGSLIITGTPDGDVDVIAKANNQYQVVDNGKSIGIFTGVTGDIAFRLNDVPQDLTVDMKTFTAPRNITVAMGSIANEFTLTSSNNSNTDVTGSVTITSKNGAFTAVDLGSKEKIGGSLTVNHGAGDTIVLLGGVIGKDVTIAAMSPNSQDNTLFTLQSTALVAGNVTINSASNNTGTIDVNLASGSKITGSVLASFSAGSNVVTAAGEIGKNLTVTSFNNTTSASVDVDVTGTLGGGLSVGVGLNNNGSGNLNVTTAVGGGVNYIGGRYGDVVNFSAAADVQRGASFNLGAGNDTLTMDGDLNLSMGVAITQGIFVDAGAGDDTVTLNSVIKGSGGVFLGAGNDLLDLNNGSFQTDTFMSGMNTFSRVVTNGGSGTDTINGYTGQDIIFLQPSSRNGDYEVGTPALPPIPPPVPPVPPVPPSPLTPPMLMTYNFSNRPAP